MNHRWCRNGFNFLNGRQVELICVFLIVIIIRPVNVRIEWITWCREKQSKCSSRSVHSSHRRSSGCASHDNEGTLLPSWKVRVTLSNTLHEAPLIQSYSRRIYNKLETIKIELYHNTFLYQFPQKTRTHLSNLETLWSTLRYVTNASDRKQRDRLKARHVTPSNPLNCTQ